MLLTDSPINSTAVDITPQLHLELSQIAAPRLVEQPASVTQLPVQEQKNGAGSVTLLAATLDKVVSYD